MWVLVSFNIVIIFWGGGDLSGSMRQVTAKTGLTVFLVAMEDHDKKQDVCLQKKWVFGFKRSTEWPSDLSGSPFPSLDSSIHVAWPLGSRLCPRKVHSPKRFSHHPMKNVRMN